MNNGVSGIYRLAAPVGEADERERDRRMKAILWRLVKTHGQEKVREMVYNSDVPNDLSSVKARILLHLL